MLINIYYLEKYAQMRMQEMLEAKRLEQLNQEVKADKPHLWQKVMWWTGGWMIGLGHKLK